MLSKKRQPSKSIEGAPQSELSQIHNTAANTLIETSSGALSSPASTLASTGAATSLTNGPHNILQGRTSLSDDRNTARTLPEDGTWSVGTGQDGIHNLPPAPPGTATSNTTDSNGFSWSLFAPDTDWQFDLGLPFAPDHPSASTGPGSTALTDLEMSRFYNQPSKGFDSAGCSGDLLEYLNLSEKVSGSTTFSNFL